MDIKKSILIIEAGQGNIEAEIMLLEMQIAELDEKLGPFGKRVATGLATAALGMGMAQGVSADNNYNPIDGYKDSPNRVQPAIQSKVNQKMSSSEISALDHLSDAQKQYVKQVDDKVSKQAEKVQSLYDKYSDVEHSDSYHADRQAISKEIKTQEVILKQLQLEEFGVQMYMIDADKYNYLKSKHDSGQDFTKNMRHFKTANVVQALQQSFK